MMPRRNPSCDGTYCEPTDTGWWHSGDCLSAAEAPAEDMALATAHEDGYARPLLATVPQQNRRAA